LKVKTEQIAVSGVLAALTVVLGATGVGFVPLPTPAGAATLMHIPVILAGILEGSGIGSMVGLIFGLFTLRFMGDWRVVIPARLLIGPVSYWVYVALKKKPWSLPLAAAAGSITNTVGTLALAVTFGYIPLAGKAGAISIAVMQGVPEAIVSALLIPPIVMAVNKAMHRV